MNPVDTFAVAVAVVMLLSGHWILAMFVFAIVLSDL